jgi:hypothetical protein
MKRLAVILVLASLAMGQDVQHAPTKEQCEADARLWTGPTTNLQAIVNDPEVTEEELINRSEAMRTCNIAYPDDVYFLKAHTVLLKAHWKRLNDFLERHPTIAARFVAEDEAGKR